MTKQFCDHCEKEIPFIGGVWFALKEGYFAKSNCLSNNPRLENSFEFCSIQCAKEGFAAYLDDIVKA